MWAGVCDTQQAQPLLPLQVLPAIVVLETTEGLVSSVRDALFASPSRTLRVRVPR